MSKPPTYTPTHTFTFYTPHILHTLTHPHRNGIINMMSNSLFKYLRENGTSGETSLYGGEHPLIVWISPYTVMSMLHLVVYNVI